MECDGYVKYFVLDEFNSKISKTQNNDNPLVTMFNVCSKHSFNVEVQCLLTEGYNFPKHWHCPHLILRIQVLFSWAKNSMSAMPAGQQKTV